MNASLVSCTTEDVDVLRALSIKTFYETFAAMNSAENMKTYLEQAYDRNKLLGELHNPNSQFFFLRADGAAAGYLKLNEAPAQTEIHDTLSLEIERIYISSGFQGKGLGQYMMEQALHIAEARQKRYVWLGVWEKNEKALGFYHKNGFYKQGTHSFCVGDDEQTDYIMRKDLMIRY